MTLQNPNLIAWYEQHIEHPPALHWNDNVWLPDSPASWLANCSVEAAGPSCLTSWFTCFLVGPLQCGSCWAFSLVGALESVRAKEGHPLEQLSVQQVLDCSYEDQGCEGGSTIRALTWLKKVEVQSAFSLLKMIISEVISDSFRCISYSNSFHECFHGELRSF